MDKVSYSELDGVRFYVISDEEKKRESMSAVHSTNIMKENMPYEGGIYDAHFGSTSRNWECDSCGNYQTLCPGHPGHLELRYPVISPLFMNDVMKFLKVICFNCGKLFVRERKMNIARERWLGEYAKTLQKHKVCIHCGEIHPHPSWDKNDFTTIMIERAERNKDGKIVSVGKLEKLYTRDIIPIFERISSETLEKLGRPAVSHPRHMIQTVVKVPPNTIRPEIKSMEGSRNSTDDLTVLLQAIVKTNLEIPSIIPKNIDDSLNNSILRLNHLVHSFIKGVSETSGKRSIISSTKGTLMSVAKKQKRKTGRIRKHLLGCRFRNGMRSVITCDPSSKIDELGIPRSQARKLEIEEVVREYNKDRLMVYYMNGINKYPGCKRVRKANDTRLSAVSRLHDNKYELQYGDVVYRDVVNGDVVYFNRQPSLTLKSVLAHKVKIIPYGFTFRINVLVCPYYNADFDGDAMNAYIASSEATQMEISQLGAPDRFLVSYQHGTPVIGEAQDSLIGTAELTRSMTRIDKFHKMYLFGNTNCFPDFGDISHSGISTGRDILTVLFQTMGHYINLKKKPSIYNESLAPYVKYNPEDINVEISRGVFKSGIIDKACIGEGRAGSIFHIINNEYSSKEALEASYNIQQIALRYLRFNGFTVGINDVIIGEESMRMVHNIESALIRGSEIITQELNEGKIIAPLGKTIVEFFEEKQLNELSRGDKLIEPIFRSIDLQNNGFCRLVLTGSKGKMENIESSVSAIGQVQMSGERIKENFDGRTCPYVPRFDSDPRGRGYIASSYISGTKLMEFIFNSMEARLSLIGIALGTSVSGEQNRISIKNLESQVVNNLRQLSKSPDLVQPLYGDDGADPRFMERNSIPIASKKLSDSEFEKLYKSKASSFKKFNNSAVQKLLDEEFEQLKEYREFSKNMFLKIEKMYEKLYQNTVKVPFNMKRIINNIVHEEDLRGDINPVDSIEIVKELCRTLPYVFINEIQEARNTPIPEYMESAVKMSRIVIMSYLNMAEISRKNITTPALKLIYMKVKQTYKKALIGYGTAMGIIAAQSMSEPMTQLALDSKHRAGLGGGKVRGMSRIKEIIAAKDVDAMKSPTAFLPLKDKYKNDKIVAHRVANQIEMMPFRLFVKSFGIFYEKYGEPIHPDYAHEKKLISGFEKFGLVKRPLDITKWVIRFELNKMSMILKQMDIETIYNKLQNIYPATYIVYSSENEDVVVMRIYVRSSMFPKKDITKEMIIGLKDKLLDQIIRGIPGIISAKVIETNETQNLEDGTLKMNKIYTITTQGTNLSKLAENPYIDSLNMHSDSIAEMERFYGITVANNTIISELRDQIEIDSKHYRNFADEMTFTGTTTPIGRHGIAKRTPRDFMLRISESSPITVMESAAANDMKDKLNGVSGRIMLGSVPRIGSNYNQLVVNEKMLKEVMEDVSDVLDNL